MHAEDERELLKKIRALEESQAELKQQVFKLQRPDRRGSSSPASASRRTGMSARHHVMAMQSLGQAAHVLDLQGKVLYWNQNAERLYHYSSAEAVGQDITRLIIHPDDVPAIIGSIFTGKCWRGKFPVKKKSGERFVVVADATPLYDDDGSLMGPICLSDDTRTLNDELIGPSTSTSGTHSHSSVEGGTAAGPALKTTSIVPESASKFAMCSDAEDVLGVGIPEAVWNSLRRETLVHADTMATCCRATAYIRGSG